MHGIYKLRAFAPCNFYSIKLGNFCFGLFIVFSSSFPLPSLFMDKYEPLTQSITRRITHEMINDLQIAALSPADINYDETLSTLRYGK